jgi:hypothetical protein
MMRKQGLFIILAILLSAQLPLIGTGPNQSQASHLGPSSTFHPSADPGVQTDLPQYLVVEMTDASTPARGSLLTEIMRSRGIVTRLATVSEALIDPSIVTEPAVIVVDASVGSDNGTGAPDSFIQLLIRSDAAVILIGRAAWALHRLRGIGPPSATAPLSELLHTTPVHEGAVFLSYPESLTLNSLLTYENGITLPDDPVQTEYSRLVDLTGRTTPTAVPALRYDSWPLDVFLFGPEDPAQFTDDGIGLLINTVAYATSLRESPTTLTLGGTQAVDGEPLAGGLSYIHEPTLQSAYYSVHTARSILGGADWTTWRGGWILVQRLVS